MNVRSRSLCRLAAGLVAAVLTLCLVAGVAKAEPRSAGITGEWYIPLAERLSTCLREERAWSWDTDLRKAYLFAANGERIGSWDLPDMVRSFTPNDACTAGWFVSREGKTLVAIHQGDPTVAVMRQPLPFEIGSNSTFIDEAGTHAFVESRAEKTRIMEIDRVDHDLVARDAPSTLERFKGDFVTHSALQGEALWVRGYDFGVHLLDGGVLHTIPGTEKIDIGFTYVSGAGRFIWIVPSDKNGQDGLGVYVADAKSRTLLNGGRRVLERFDIRSIWSALMHDYVWAKDVDDQVHALKVDASGLTPVVTELSQGRPLSGPDKKPLRVGDMLLATGIGAWAWPPDRFSGSNTFDQLFRVQIERDALDAVAVDLPRRRDHPEFPRDFRTASRHPSNPNRALVKVSDGSYFEVGNDPHLFIDHSKFPQFWIDFVKPATDPRFAWVGAAPLSYVRRDAALSAGEITAEIDLGRLHLGAPNENSSASWGASDGAEANVKLQWPVPSSVKLHGRLSLRILRGDHELARGEADYNSSGTKIALLSEPSLRNGGTIDVVLTYTDVDPPALVTLTWTKVHLTTPLLERVLGNTWVRAIGALLLALIGVAIPSKTRAWAPVVAPVLSAGVGRYVDAVKFDFAQLLVVATACVVLTIGAALASPGAFRGVSNFHPFKVLAAIALRIPRIRRVVFRDHIKRFARTLRTRDVARVASGRPDTELKANRALEYCELPIRMVLPPREATTHASEIYGALTREDVDSRVHVLIEAVGGRGKSRLLGEIGRLALRHWETDATRPLPVFALNHGGTLRERLRASIECHELARAEDAKADDQLDFSAVAGDILLLVDGPLMTQLQVDDIARFVREASGRRVRLCLAERPSTTLRGALEESCENLLVVEPMGLVREPEDTLGQFMAHCARAFPLGERQPLHADALGACIAPDKTYSPLLVQLALANARSGGGEAPARAPATLVDVYEGALVRLLAGQEADIDFAMKLAAETYYERRQRSFARRRAGGAEAEYETVTRLMQAGLLVPSEASAVPGHRPSTIRFFHDSMQTYLAARFYATAVDLTVLEPAVGDPFFNRATANLTPSGGSELFQMCVLRFPHDLLAERLEKVLVSWREALGPALSIAEVKSCIPEEIAANLVLDDLSSAAEHLRLATEAAAKADARAERPWALAYMVARLGSIVWPALGPKARPPSPSVVV